MATAEAKGGGAPSPRLPPGEETKLNEERFLQEAFKAVKQHAFYMKRALDENNLREALKHSAAMLGELRTSLLSPQKYYALYMKTFDELRHLEAFFAEENKRGRPNAELYELVQHAGNILPRLYLLITVGSVFIKSKEGAAKDVLKDLGEMARGVQHPIRGLFLRTYLSQVTKNLLPDTGSPYEGDGGTVVDAVEFVLQNFTEMNKLWVRMQHQGPTRDKDRREKERQELRDLVGKNLLVLSQLEGVDLPLYTSTVLPRILEQVVNCKDDIAQPYLMDAVIQVFPDEFHLHTLGTLLAVCPQLQPGVKVGGVLSGLMSRLSRYASDSPSVVASLRSADAFGTFVAAVAKVSASHGDTSPPSDIVAMHASLLSFAAAVHKGALPLVDTVLSGCASALARRAAAAASSSPAASAAAPPGSSSGGGSPAGTPGAAPPAAPAGAAAATASPNGSIAPLSDPKATRQLVALLTAPLDAYDVVSVLGLASYPKLMQALDAVTRKSVAATVVRSLLKSGAPVSSCAQADTLLAFIAPLIRDGNTGGAASSDADADDDFEEEQSLVARCVHAFAAAGSTPADAAAEQYRMLLAARRAFGTGGPRRLRHTLPPLVFAAIALARVLRQQQAAALAAAAAPAPAAAPPAVTAAPPAAASAADDGADDAAAAATAPAAPSSVDAAAASPAAAGAAASEAASSLKRLFLFLHQTVSALSDLPGASEDALRLHLHCAMAAAEAGAEEACYEFFERAFETFEEAVPDSKAQVSALHFIVGSLRACLGGLSPDSRATLGSKATGYSSKLLKKADTCRALLSCTHLSWDEAVAPEPIKDAAGVVAVLKRATKVAAAAAAAAGSGLGGGGGGGGGGGSSSSSGGDASSSPAALFLDILAKYVYFFEKRVPTVTAEGVNSLIELCRSEAAEKALHPDVSACHASTLAHIRTLKAREGEAGKRYAAIAV